MTPEAVKSLCKATAIVAVAVGGFGSLLCVPYALTNNLTLIHTAGIYFIAGGIMIVGGLLTFAHMIKPE